MSNTKYHGYRVRIDGKEEFEIGVTEMPDRKRPCIYIMRGGILYPLAYFRSEERAKEFLEAFDLTVKASMLSFGQEMKNDEKNI